jgi:hypothetical protein
MRPFSDALTYAEFAQSPPRALFALKVESQQLPVDLRKVVALFEDEAGKHG